MKFSRDLASFVGQNNQWLQVTTVQVWSPWEILKHIIWISLKNIHKTFLPWAWSDDFKFKEPVIQKQVWRKYYSNIEVVE